MKFISSHCTCKVNTVTVIFPALREPYTRHFLHQKHLTRQRTCPASEASYKITYISCIRSILQDNVHFLHQKHLTRQRTLPCIRIIIQENVQYHASEASYKTTHISLHQMHHTRQRTIPCIRSIIQENVHFPDYEHFTTSEALYKTTYNSLHQKHHTR